MQPFLKNNDLIQRLILYIEEIENLNSWQIFDYGANVNKLEFILDNKIYKINYIYTKKHNKSCNANFYIDYYFVFNYNKTQLELIYKSLDNKYYINSKVIKNINFILDKQIIDLKTIILKQDNTPNDYFNIKRWVYFQIGGYKQGSVTLKDIISILNIKNKDFIKDKEYGFSIYIATQEIPNIIKVLSLKFAIYYIKEIS